MIFWLNCCMYAPSSTCGAYLQKYKHTTPHKLHNYIPDNSVPKIILVNLIWEVTEISISLVHGRAKWFSELWTLLSAYHSKLIDFLPSNYSIDKLYIDIANSTILKIQETISTIVNTLSRLALPTTKAKDELMGTRKRLGLGEKESTNQTCEICNRKLNV